MGVLELVEQKAFLGTEFATWLWHKSELGEGVVEVDGIEPIEVAFQDAMTLEAQFGDATVQTLRGDIPGAWADARAALLEGKKIKRSKIHIVYGELEYTFTLRADTFDFSSCKIPAPSGLPFEEGVSIRLQAAERLFDLIDRLYAAFLTVRLDDNAWSAELKRIHKWVEEK